MAGVRGGCEVTDNAQIFDLSHRDVEEMDILRTPELVIGDLYETYLWHTQGLKDSKQH